MLLQVFMRSKKKGETTDDGGDVAYSALKAITGGLMLLFGWAVSASTGGVDLVLGGFIGLGGGLIASEFRETGIARILFAATLVGIAGIVFNQSGWEASNVVLAILGIAGIILAYEASRRHSLRRYR